jgi:zinc protease
MKALLKSIGMIALLTTSLAQPYLSAAATNEGDRSAMTQDQLPAGVAFVTEGDGIRQYQLANGMKVLLVENRVAPVATVLVVYKVGSRNEAVGYTGSTHLLEHMMFKGTPTFNKASNTQIAATLQKIGADFNATTWYDRTNYYETVPSDQIEIAIKLEADRMRNSFINDSDRQAEMTVVRNELERGQNEPTQVLDEAVYAAAFREHPYHHPTIGWRSDVEGVPTARLKAFYDTFYHPNNATAVIVGDFDRANALQLLNKYFGAYPAAQKPIPQVYTEEPQQQGERRLVIHRAGELAVVEIAFHTPGVLGQMNVLSNEELTKRAANQPADNDTYPLVVLSAAMSNGVTSRLYQSLVEKQLAVNVNTNADQHRDPGLFVVVATVRPGVTPKQVEDVILAELHRVAEHGLTDKEVQKAKQQILAQVAYNRDGTFNIAVQVSEAEAVADWRLFQDYAANVTRVNPAGVQRVAQKYFTEDNRTVGYFIPKHEGQGGKMAGPSGLRPTFGRGLQFYSEPGTGGEGAASNEREEERNPGAGGSTTPQAKALQPVWPRSDKSSDAVRANTPGAGRSNFASRITRTQLPNGATLLVLENHATPALFIRGSLRAGSYFEPRDKPGLARITAGMLERGTNKRSKLQLAGDIESVGAEIEFSADAFALNVSARCLSKDVPLVISTIAEELREPAFPGDELEKLKQQVIAGIQEQQANTRFRSYERFTEIVYDPSSPFYVTPAQQLIKSISSITVEDVRRFHTAHYGGQSLILAVAGDVSAAELGTEFKQSFGSFEGPKGMSIDVTDPSPQSAARREVVLLKDKANVDILLGSPAPLRRSSPDYYAALLANNALGQSTLSSRLGLQVRDKEGLTYGIGSVFRAPSLAAGPWYVGVSVNPNNVDKAINSAIGVLRNYVKNGIRPDELADEKSSAIGAFKVSLATNEGLAEALWNAEFFNLGIDYIDRFPELVQAVTIEQVNAAIRKYFRPDQLTVVIAGDYPAATPAPAANK